MESQPTPIFKNHPERETANNLHLVSDGEAPADINYSLQILRNEMIAGCGISMAVELINGAELTAVSAATFAAALCLEGIRRYHNRIDPTA